MSRVAVIGLVGRSVFLGVDHFHVGGETLRARDFHFEFGGKGCNQAVAASRWGAEVAFLGAIGRADAAKATAALGREDVRARLVEREGDSAYAVIVTDSAGATHVTVYEGEAVLAVEDVAAFAPEIISADVLLLTNEVPPEVNDRAAEIAERHGVRIVLNPAPSRPLSPTLRRCVSLYTPNAFETADLPDAAEQIVTLGAEGCLVKSTGRRLPAARHGQAVDTTGAGDTFNGVLAALLAEGASIEEAAEAANDAAGRSVCGRYVMPSIPRRPARL